MLWTPDVEALDLLDRIGGPFERVGYRAACVETQPLLTDQSFGARAADGTQAAVALLADARSADSVPFGYGAVRSTRPLTPTEALSLLDAARGRARRRRLVLRAIRPLGGLPIGRQIATTSIVTLDKPPENRFEAQARRKIRRAERRGCSVSATSFAESFLRLHNAAARSRHARYPDALVRRLAERNELTFYNGVVDGEVVSSIAAFTRGEHWMYWLGAQDERGRAVEAGYAVVASLLAAAYAAGIPFVNLGASEGLPGVATFKQRLGGVEQPVDQVVLATALVRIVDGAMDSMRTASTGLRTNTVLLSRRLGLR